MKKILSERNLVAILFVSALLIFSLAQEDTRRAEKKYRDAQEGVSTLIPEQEPAQPVSASGLSPKAASLQSAQ